MKETIISHPDNNTARRDLCFAFNENFCVQFIHIMKHYVLYLWFLGLCFMFRMLGRCHVALGGGNDIAIDDDPSRVRFMRVCVILNGLLRDFRKNRRKCFSHFLPSPLHNSQTFPQSNSFVKPTDHFSFMSRHCCETSISRANSPQDH